MIIYAVVLASLAWVFWQFIRPFVEKSPLDVVPGPTRKSLISGTFLLCRLSPIMVLIPLQATSNNYSIGMLGTSTMRWRKITARS